MITRTYISKFTTIIKDSDINTGINPVAELVYGSSVSRLLFYFDHHKIKKMIEEKIFPDVSKLKHYIKITNAGSLDFTQMHCGDISSITDDLKIRASSFDIIFFLIPNSWDNGKGFDYARDFFNQGYFAKPCSGLNFDSKKLLSYDACTWYKYRNGYNWEEEGIYSNETLSKEYDKWSSEEGSKIIIGRQRFDIGNENINFDITDIMNKFISGELENNGIAIAYAPNLERTSDDVENYTGFLTHKTNTFFEPFVETIYDDYIDDDRSNFALDKNNRLYLYCNVGEKLENLDETPTCTIDDVEYEVKQATKGVYYVDVMLSSKENTHTTMHYDTWSNIKYQGVELDDVELDFVTKTNKIFFNIGSSLSENTHFTPSISGILQDERIKRGDLRKVIFLNKVNYEKNKQSLVDDMQWRLYIKDGTREVDVFKWEHVNKTFLENYALIDTTILIPQRYYIDVKYTYNMEVIDHHDVLHFDIVDDLNNKYN